jgi:hypothetical protein
MVRDAVALYVLAHQDDEYGCIAQLRSDVAARRRVIVVFLTDGSTPSIRGEVRTAESRAVLERIGILPRDVVVIGTSLGIPSFGLPQQLERAYGALLAWLRSAGIAKPVQITTVAWEGGHADHDAAHLAAARLARELAVSNFREVSLYNAHRRFGPFFRVMSFCDGAAVGDDAGPRLLLIQALRDALVCWRYRSQRTTWLGLFPGALARLLMRRRHAVRTIALPRSARRPHAGPLYYERRWGLTYEGFTALTAGFAAGAARDERAANGAAPQT